MAGLRDETDLTAVAVAATIDGDLAGAAVSGERRRDSGISVTVDDRWHMGSITKSMTATLLAVLEDDGLLSAADALTVLLPDVEMADGWSGCTLDHLLTHTAGVAANFPTEFQDVWPETAEELVAERRRFIADVLADEPESPCGESFQYSNIGYTIAGHIAETIAGEPYEGLIQNRVFAPLALMSAGFGPPRGEYPDREPVGHAILLFGFTRVQIPIDPSDPGRARLGRRFPDLAQRQQYVLVRTADVVAGQEHDPGVRDQRRRDRGGRHRVRRAGAGAERNGAGVLIGKRNNLGS